MRPSASIALGAAAVTAITWTWHGPAGVGERVAGGMEAQAGALLTQYEMGQVRARVERDPISRRIILSGPADDFQRRELKRMMEQLPGVGEAVWDPASLEAEAGR